MSDYIQYVVRVFDNGSKFWYINDRLHREDGPAQEFASGKKCWCRNDRLHREDGPAIEFDDGEKRWYRNGKLHREDGPAIEWANGEKYWFIDNIEYTETDFNTKLYFKKNSCNGKIVEIDGKKYKLTAI